ncbi:GerAB/ArcD/ProY family transporter [Clostridium merdae]|uniref:GerAB/ArcD/ProY family transporter n=1 Tax=Clostridium merdae TaxID=1958780 RepID=UPI000A26A9B1|nr:endospore germination permease [Clostridium merdae]
MITETKKVHGLDFMFAVACYIQSSSLLSSFFASITRQDSWLIVLFALVVCCPIIWFYSKLIERFPDKNLFSIMQKIYGKYLGKFICAMYLIFFIVLTSLNLSDLSQFVQATIMPKTPLIVVSFTFLLTSAWGIYGGGMRQMVKYGFLMTMICLFVVIASILLTLNVMEFDNFLPILDLNPKKYIQATNIVVTIPICEIVIFLMTTNQVRTGKHGYFPYIFGGVAIGCFTILLVIMRDIAVLGNTISLFSLPSFETLRMVSVTQTLSRMEIVFAFILISLLFFKVTWLYYVTVLSAAHVFRFQDHRRLILLTGALVVASGFILYPNPLAHNESGQKIAPLLWPVFEIILPILTLAIAKFRGITTKQANSNQQNNSAKTNSNDTTGTQSVPGGKTPTSSNSGSKGQEKPKSDSSSPSASSGSNGSVKSQSQSHPKPNSSGSGSYQSQSVSS